MSINNTDGNIIRHRDRIWNNYQRALIPVYPPHLPVDPGEEECRELLRMFHPYFIRWTSSWDCSADTGFWFVIKDGKEDISAYSPGVRYSIRQGIRNFSARIISKESLIAEGYDVYLSALQRYRGPARPYTELQFREQLIRLFGIGEWEFWGLFDNESGKMAGYSMNWIYDSSCEYKTIKVDPGSLKRSGNYLLLHEMNRYYLNDRGFRYVNDGSRSLMHESNIQEFLERTFLFRKSYCRMHIRYSRPVALAVRVLYPFRKLLFALPVGPVKKAGTLLKHEEIARKSRLLDEH
jgi:hypothetical protein